MKRRTLKKQRARDIYETVRAIRMLQDVHLRWLYQARFDDGWEFELGLGNPVKPGGRWVVPEKRGRLT